MEYEHFRKQSALLFTYNQSIRSVLPKVKIAKRNTDAGAPAQTSMKTIGLSMPSG
jgi:hypothetical protein